MTPKNTSENTARNIIIMAKEKLAPKNLTNNTAWIIYARIRMGAEIGAVATTYKINQTEVMQTVTKITEKLQKHNFSSEILIKKINTNNRSRRVHWSQSQENELYDLYYKKDYTQQDLADLYKISKSAICQRLQKINERKGYQKNKYPVRLASSKISSQQALEIYNLVLLGNARKTIAAKFSISNNTVTTIYKKVHQDKENRGETLDERKFPKTRDYTYIPNEFLMEVLAEWQGGTTRQQLQKKYKKSRGKIDYYIAKAKQLKNSD